MTSNTTIMPPDWSLLSSNLQEMEEKFNSYPAIKYVNETWTVALWFGLVYVIGVQLGHRFMRDKERFNLRLPLALWSGSLAIFSIMGTLRSGPELIEAYFGNDFEYSVCNPNYFLKNPSAFWSFVMVYSKFIELGDTVFIILRKQPLIFLHWYHHLTVLCYGTYSYGQLVATGRWFVVMNFIVHSFMYTYYALKAMRFRIPKQVSMLITFSQILQMVVGIVTNLAGLYYLRAGRQCRTSHGDVFIAFAMYTSYLILFANFFYQAYLKPKPSAAKVSNGHPHTNGVATNNNNKKNK